MRLSDSGYVLLREGPEHRPLLLVPGPRFDQARRLGQDPRRDDRALPRALRQRHHRAKEDGDNAGLPAAGLQSSPSRRGAKATLAPSGGGRLVRGPRHRDIRPTLRHWPPRSRCHSSACAPLPRTPLPCRPPRVMPTPKIRQHGEKGHVRTEFFEPSEFAKVVDRCRSICKVWPLRVPHRLAAPGHARSEVVSGLTPRRPSDQKIRSPRRHTLRRHFWGFHPAAAVHVRIS